MPMNFDRYCTTERLFHCLVFTLALALGDSLYSMAAESPDIRIVHGGAKRPDFALLASAGIEPLYQEFVAEVVEASPEKIDGIRVELVAWAVHHVKESYENAVDSPVTLVQQGIFLVRGANDRASRLVLMNRPFSMGAEAGGYWGISKRKPAVIGLSVVSDAAIAEALSRMSFGRRFVSLVKTKCLIIEYFGEDTLEIRSAIEKPLSNSELDRRKRQLRLDSFHPIE